VHNEHNHPADHPDGLPTLLRGVGIEPRRRKRIVEHEGRSLEAEPVSRLFARFFRGSNVQSNVRLFP